MPEAVLGRLAVRGLVPRDMGTRPALALEQALGAPLADALTEAFQGVAAVDPGALWVLRRLDARIPVPASEPDPATQSRRVANGLVHAVIRVVADGPSSDAVRFPSRSHFLAAYVRARMAGFGASWVFERLRAIDVLPVADALLAATRIVAVGLLEVVGELVVGGGWTRLLAISTEPEVSRLAAAVSRRGDGVHPTPELVAEVARVWAVKLASAPGAVGSASGARARMELLAELGVQRPVTADLVAAVVGVGAMMPSVASASPGLPESGPFGASGGLPSPSVGDSQRAVGSRPPDATALPGPGGSLNFACAGAGAFLLLPDLAELLAGEDELRGTDPAAAAVRAAVLVGALGMPVAPDDEAVRLAAGWSVPPEPPDWQACLSGPVAAWAGRLAADPVLGWRHRDDSVWVAPALAQQPELATVAIALLRRFARHLHGFGQSRAAHLMPQVVPFGGTISLRSEQTKFPVIEAVLPTGPLHVLLALAGLDAFTYRVEWLPAQVYVSHEVPT